jgi:pimeloyl-ACP methyl ester carboxylesterase
MPALSAEILPAGVSARFVANGNGLRMHLLEAGAGAARPLLLLLHGFPELAYSWRKLMPSLAAEGYHVVAPDQRGYGRTTGWDGGAAADPEAYAMPNLVRDVDGLITALGHGRVAAVIGHDFGAPVAAWCALMLPERFPALAMMSAPFAGPPPIPGAPRFAEIDAGLAALSRPRKHYQGYYSTPAAAREMDAPEGGLAAFLRAYYHVKSGDWRANAPHRLASWAPSELAKMPTYYIMDRAASMPETVAGAHPSADESAACRWLPPAELAIYAEEFARTGFAGGLRWYHAATSGAGAATMRRFAGRAIAVPTIFIAGAADWGIYQAPGSFERMQESACADFRGAHLLARAGHWVQQEQPQAVTTILQDFLRSLDPRR